MSLLDFVLSVLRAFGFEDFQAKLSTRPPEKSVGEDELWDEATEGLRAALDRSGLDYITDEGGGVLRPEDRRRRQGRHRPGVAAVDHPARLQPARTFRSRVRRQRWRAQATRDDPSGADGFGRALLRRADRALRGRLPGMAGTDPGPGPSGGRGPRRPRARCRRSPAFVGLPGRCRRRGRTARQASPKRQGRKAAVHPRGRRRRRRNDTVGVNKRGNDTPERDVTVDDFIARLGDDVENKV